MDALPLWSPNHRFLAARAAAATGRIPRPDEADDELRSLIELLWELERAEARGVRLPRRFAITGAAKALTIHRTRSHAVVIEALVLARCTLPLISNLLDLPLATIDAYRTFFFDVQRHLDKPQIILDNAILCDLTQEGIKNPVRHAAMKMISYFCGAAPFLDLYGLDRRHSRKVWSLPSTHMKKVEVAARIDSAVELLAHGATRRDLDFDSVCEELRDVLGVDFAAYPHSTGPVDYVPRLDLENHNQFLAGMERAT